MKQPGVLDHAKIRVLVWTRYLNHRAIQRWARKTFRRARAPATLGLELQTAADHYGTPTLPEQLRVPKQMPPEAGLRSSYLLPYYYVTGFVFRLYERFPIGADVAWSPDLAVNDAFPRNREGWGDATDDATFARLRLQGPNPFLLTRRGEGRFEVDYTPFFRGIHPPVVCSFVLDGGELLPERIEIDGTSVERGAEGWERAKIVANALDARYCVFTRHLFDTHLVVGQAYALSAYVLPTDHPLRGFLDFFTYGTLVVNDFAYRLLVTPSSYFLLGRFLSGDDIGRLFRNSADAFALDTLIVPEDVRRRGIDAIPDHPYVQDALEAWAILSSFVGSHLDGLYPDDRSIAADPALQGWYGELADLLPNHDVTAAPLTSRDQLRDVLTCLLYNNVVHEVCGDFSPYFASRDPEHKKAIDFERVKAGDFDGHPDLASAFLMDQGAFASTFNNGGNNLLTLDVTRHVPDPGLRSAVAELQRRLRDHDEVLVARNAAREVPFHRMMPRRWEASISF